jgi:phosphoenolpyruvate synthase/pyruvate phosphate dikinase
LEQWLNRRRPNTDGDSLDERLHAFLRETVQVPRGIALPFSLQSQFLESAPKVQQLVGKLKMALELGAREVEPLSVELSRMIRATKLSEQLRGEIDRAVARCLSGASSFVVRSSSNAEDLPGFSAAGVYQSVTSIRTAEGLFEGVKEVWASLVSPRSVRLRAQAGISLDDCYMGVVIQEEVQSRLGGVLVSCNPMDRSDFRNCLINASESTQAASAVVSGKGRPYQFLYNAVEGGGRTLSLGDAQGELPEADRELLGRLAVVGKLLQGHFSPDYRFDQPVDVEWVIERGSETVWLVQVRPFA